MPRADRIPDAHELLCESCGYSLSGLAPAGNCPECGRPIADSLPNHRHLTSWEVSKGLGRVPAFLCTAAAVLLRPKRFFRHLAIGPSTASVDRSNSFGWICRLTAWLLLTTSVVLHARSFGLFAIFPYPYPRAFETFMSVLVLGLLTVGTLLVGGFTAWEAAYRGLRLPIRTVLRALDYHAVHVIVPSLLGFAIVVGYAVLLRYDPVLAADVGVNYLYTLAFAIVIGALYLFKTYWTAMRNLMYANG